MRTSTAAWTAALAVMSMKGPFTTAEAAPARRVEQEQPRPMYDKLRKRQGFNDSDTPDAKPNPLNVPSIPPLLGDSSSLAHDNPTPSPDPSRTDPNHTPDHVPVPLTSSTSLPADSSPPDRSGDRPADSQDPPTPTPSDSNPADPLLSSLLHPTSDFTFSLAPPRVEPSSAASTTSRDGPDNDPLLGSITGQLSNVLPDATGASSGPITVGVTTILHQTSNLPLPSIKATGDSGPEHTRPNLLSNLPVSNLPAGSIIPTKSLEHVPDQVSSFLAHATGNNPRPNDQQSTTPSGDGPLQVTSILPSGLGDVTSVIPSRIPPVGTAVSRLPTSEIHSILSSIKSDVPPVVPTGTGNLGSVLPTITGTGGQPVVSPIQSVLPPLPTATGPLNSILPPITGTGGLPPLPTPVPSQLPPVPPPLPTSVLSQLPPVPPPLPTPVPSQLPPVPPPGISGPVTGTDPLPNPTSIISSVLSDPTATLDSITSPLGSVIPTPPVGTGDLSAQPPVVTATVDGSTVTIAVPTNSASQTGASPAPVTAPPGSTNPVVTASVNAPETAASEPEPTNSAQVSQPATSFDTAPAKSETVPTNPNSAKPSNPPISVAPQISIVATGTNTQTSLTLPTQWSFAPSPLDKTTQDTTGIATAVSTTLTSVGLPTTMARLVQPPGGMPNPPSNFTLIQVGFRFGLNYPFVVGKPESALEIFKYLPEGLAYGLGISKDQVLMNALMPFDTSETLGYITTLAQTYIPHDLVDELQLNLHAPASPLYSNPSAPVNALMNMVNPTIPNIPGANLDGQLSYSFGPSATTRAGEADGAPIGGDAGSAKRVRGTSAAIGAGAIAGAAVYAAAMIYVARRYRQRRKGHQRVSSVPTAGEMTQRSSGGMGAVFMSGANGRASSRGSASNSGGRGSRTSNGSSNGRSVREQGISAPLMSENSLGWN